MKKYVIITRRVTSMGGAQLYILRRFKHLKSRGYEVCIVVSKHENYFPLEKEFEGATFLCVPEIDNRLVFQTKKKQSLIVENIVNFIGDFEDLIIESHTLSSIEWGELIALKCGAKHLAYPLSEATVSQYKFLPGKEIFRDKLNRGEFYGCSSTSLSFIFDKRNVPNNYVNIGYDETELAAECIPQISYRKKAGDFVVTTITRLDKTYIEFLADAIAQLSVKYRSRNFVLLIVGGCSDIKREMYLKSSFNNEKYGLSNLDIRYLGYIDKLGKDIFRLTDVFVGMGTAAINAISQRCISINIDPMNGMQFSSGFFGVDTKNFAYSETGKVYPIIVKLESALLLKEDEKEKLKITGRRLFDEEFEINQCFRKLDQVVESLPVVCHRNSLEVTFFYRLFVRGLICFRKLINSRKL